MKIYVVRHGITPWNRLKKVQGNMDIPLAPEGAELARRTGEALRDVPFACCYSSPLTRAVETARAILGDRTVPLILDSRIEEMHFGKWEGTRYKDDEGNYINPAIERFFQNPGSYERPEGGENFQDILARTRDFWEELIHNQELKDKTVLVSSHGCAVRAILQNVYRDPENFWHGSVPTNCSVNIVEVTDGQARLVEEDKVYAR